MRLDEPVGASSGVDEKAAEVAQAKEQAPTRRRSVKFAASPVDATATLRLAR
jgi:hypothetical protein